MLGGLHTEMALSKTLGDVLEGSGCTEALTEGEVVSSGVAESFLKAAHLTRTRYGHQVTLLALHYLQHEAFMQCKGPKDKETAQAWRNNMIRKSPTFACWDLISYGTKPSFSSSSGLIGKGTFHCMCKSWRNSHHCFLPWIMSIMQDGCQSISRI